jgi:hypothetical protein
MRRLNLPRRKQGHRQNHQQETMQRNAHSRFFRFAPQGAEAQLPSIVTSRLTLARAIAYPNRAAQRKSRRLLLWRHSGSAPENLHFPERRLVAARPRGDAFLRPRPQAAHKGGRVRQALGAVLGLDALQQMRGGL